MFFPPKSPYNKELAMLMPRANPLSDGYCNASSRERQESKRRIRRKEKLERLVNKGAVFRFSNRPLWLKRTVMRVADGAFGAAQVGAVGRFADKKTRDLV